MISSKPSLQCMCVNSLLYVVICGLIFLFSSNNPVQAQKTKKNIGLLIKYIDEIIENEPNTPFKGPFGVHSSKDRYLYISDDLIPDIKNIKIKVYKFLIRHKPFLF